MGCSNTKSTKSLPVIVKKETITDKHSMNPHNEDGEAEVVNEGKKQNDKRDSHDLDVASKIAKNESQAYQPEGPLSQTLPVAYINSSIVEAPVYVNTTVNNHHAPSEKPNFPIHEHKFEFDFLDEEKQIRENPEKHHQEVDDVLKELNNI